MSETNFWEAKPIRHTNQLKELNDKMDSLTNIEFSSRLLLGALYRQMKVPPQDYVFDSLQTQIRKMEKGDPEFELIHQFITNTSDN